MTIEECIQKLQELQKSNPGVKVVCTGFDEDGYDDVETIEPVMIKQRTRIATHCGKYIGSDDFTYTKTGPEEKAIHINF